MKRLGSLQLFLIKEDGSQNYLFQNTLIGDPFRSSIEFNFYKKQSEEHSWQRVYKRNPYASWMNSIYEEGLTLSGLSNGGLTIDAETRRPQYRREFTTTIDEASLGSLFTSPVDASVVRPEPSAFGVRREISREEMQQSYDRHIQEHQYHAGELARRAAQREADLRRQQEERDRPRRPWDRVRDIFRG